VLDQPQRRVLVAKQLAVAEQVAGGMIFLGAEVTTDTDRRAEGGWVP
jgi:hypothetical protein